MADTTTTNYGFVQPEPGTSGWDAKMNANLEAIDQEIAARGAEAAAVADDLALVDTDLAAVEAVMPATAGVAQADRALVVDANRDITNIRHAWTERLYLGDVGGYTAVIDYNDGTGAFTITPYDDGSEQATRQFGYDPTANRWYFDAIVVATTFVGNLTGTASTALSANVCSNLLSINSLSSIAFLYHKTAGAALVAGSYYAAANLRYFGLTTDSVGTSVTNDGILGGADVPAGTWMSLGSVAPIAGRYAISPFVRIA